MGFPMVSSWFPIDFPMDQVETCLLSQEQGTEASEARHWAHWDDDADEEEEDYYCFHCSILLFLHSYFQVFTSYYLIIFGTILFDNDDEAGDDCKNNQNDHDHR